MDENFTKFNTRILNQIHDFINSRDDLLYIGGFQGCGKSEIVNLALKNIDENILLFRHLCFENSVIDDFLLGFYDNLRYYSINKKINLMQEKLTECIAQIEATLDYPEEDFEDETKTNIFNLIESNLKDINELIENSKNSSLIKNGINVALVGAPNVGKSATLNALIGENRAIVTEIEGTTRDTLTESTIYKGMKINFIDTAGIRESEDKVEKIGIEKSKQSIDKADVILFLLDGSQKLDKYDLKIKELLNGYKNVITIVNKSDLKRILPEQKGEIVISAQNENNINEIKESIFKMVKAEKIDYSHTIVTSARQIEILENSKLICNKILSNKLESMDIIAMLIKELWNSLGKITGQCENESIIDLIFSKFCLGK